MHAWEAIQKTLEHIEDHIDEEIQIEELAKIAALSLFYYQRLFARLVKKPVREYIKLRRLAKACESLRDREKRVLEVALEYGFSSHETFTRAFRDAYGVTPTQYRNGSVGLNNFDKPDLLLNYVMADEGVPLISDGLVLEMNRRTLDEPVDFLGVEGIYRFRYGRMLGERTEVSGAQEIWNKLFQQIGKAPRLPRGRLIGVCYHGGAPDGYTTYFAGVEVRQGAEAHGFTKWRLPAREYAVCGFEAEDHKQLTGPALGKAMKYTRLWLRKHGLIADGFFPEMYYHNTFEISYMELWTPFRER